MTSFLTSLLTRSSRPATAVLPRRRSPFEAGPGLALPGPALRMPGEGPQDEIQPAETERASSPVPQAPAPAGPTFREIPLPAPTPPLSDVSGPAPLPVFPALPLQETHVSAPPPLIDSLFEPETSSPPVTPRRARAAEGVAEAPAARAADEAAAETAPDPLHFVQPASSPAPLPRSQEPVAARQQVDALGRNVEGLAEAPSSQAVYSAVAATPAPAMPFDGLAETPPIQPAAPTVFAQEYGLPRAPTMRGEPGPISEPAARVRGAEAEAEAARLPARSLAAPRPAPPGESPLLPQAAPPRPQVRARPAQDAAPREEAPIIHISIGRVEVRAVTPTPSKRKAKRPEPALSLDAYLKHHPRRG